MGPIFFIIFIVILAAAFMMYRKSSKQQGNNSVNTPDKLKMYFGDDYGKIIGTSGTGAAPANSADNFSIPSVPSSSGKGPVNAVIRQKTGSIGLLGIRLALPHPENIPTQGNEKFCNLVSLMLARGIASCTKAGKNVFSIEFITEGENITVRCVHPAADMSDGNIRAAAEELSGSLSSAETAEGTADMAIIPKSNII